MLFSIYPTDPENVRQQVIEQARTSGSGLLFTSLHIPESQGLFQFGEQLQSWHRQHGLTFCADISSNTLSLLGYQLSDIAKLRQWGITMVRIDFGFDVATVQQIAASGFRIALNASTVTAAEVDEFDGIDVVGWHNYYPRPETGISEEFFEAQNELFHSRGYEVFSFIPGEVTFRAPLGLGLPMLESQRHANTYLNHAQLLSLCPETKVVCAEGVVLPQHLRMIERRETTGEVSAPMTLAPHLAGLVGQTFRIRPEGVAAAHRLEGSRGLPGPLSALNGGTRAKGSLQQDLESMGRYRGELQLIRQELPLTPHQALVGELAAPYRDLVDHLSPGQTIRIA